jgi:hypothetical protein
VTDVFLGIIAVSVLAMAIGQVAAVIVGGPRPVRRVGDRLGQLEETIRPIVSNVQTHLRRRRARDSVATAQVERAEQIMDDVALPRRRDE